MKTTIVVLRIKDDVDERPWWEALCLPEPHRWNGVNPDGSDGVFAPNTHVDIALEGQVS